MKVRLLLNAEDFEKLAFCGRNFQFASENASAKARGASRFLI